MKKFVYFFILFCIVFCGCNKESYVPKFEVINSNQNSCEFVFDKLNNVVSIYDESDYFLIKLSPPKNLTDLSEIKVWLNGEEFKNCDDIYSNGDDIFVKIYGTKRSTNVLTVKWNNSTKAEDFYINI